MDSSEIKAAVDLVRNQVSAIKAFVDQSIRKHVLELIERDTPPISAGEVQSFLLLMNQSPGLDSPLASGFEASVEAVETLLSYSLTPHTHPLVMEELLDVLVPGNFYAVVDWKHYFDIELHGDGKLSLPMQEQICIALSSEGSPLGKWTSVVLEQYWWMVSLVSMAKVESALARAAIIKKKGEDHLKAEVESLKRAVSTLSDTVTLLMQKQTDNNASDDAEGDQCEEQETVHPPPDSFTLHSRLDSSSHDDADFKAAEEETGYSGTSAVLNGQG